MAFLGLRLQFLNEESKPGWARWPPSPPPEPPPLWGGALFFSTQRRFQMARGTSPRSCLSKPLSCGSRTEGGADGCWTWLGVDEDGVGASNRQEWRNISLCLCTRPCPLTNLPPRPFLFIVMGVFPPRPPPPRVPILDGHIFFVGQRKKIHAILGDISEGLWG